MFENYDIKNSIYFKNTYDKFRSAYKISNAIMIIYIVQFILILIAIILVIAGSIIAYVDDNINNILNNVIEVVGRLLLWITWIFTVIPIIVLVIVLNIKVFSEIIKIKDSQNGFWIGMLVVLDILVIFFGGLIINLILSIIIRHKLLKNLMNFNIDPEVNSYIQKKLDMNRQYQNFNNTYNNQNWNNGEYSKRNELDDKNNNFNSNSTNQTYTENNSLNSDYFIKKQQLDPNNSNNDNNSEQKDNNNEDSSNPNNISN